ncbi:protein jagged-1b isoform X2 [Exaiptasia diaphana]|uniref:EGF-like domain-containing protein n=1 Tax=Exaiptasia diaphana TaxID=2652724 RepID=A0A913YFB1_EXADI|nr:protein jagged-1b isoform X2 [Exaiptasia diaphana]
MDRHYTFIRFNVSSVLDCFTECHKHCRCQSFNFHGSYWSAGTCELNDADAYDDKVSIIAKNGWLFYNLDRQLPVNCRESESRCCSTSQPCENNGQCFSTCEPLGRRYRCKCPYGTKGERCQIRTNDR